MNILALEDTRTNSTQLRPWRQKRLRNGLHLAFEQSHTHIRMTDTPITESERSFQNPMCTCVVQQQDRDNAARIIQRILLRELDPISLRPIRRRFALLRNGVLIAYDAHTLAEYIAATGDIRDPIARQELATHEQMRLQRVGRVNLQPIDDLRRLHHNMISARSLLIFIEQDVLREADQVLPTGTSNNVVVNGSHGRWHFMRFIYSDMLPNVNGSGGSLPDVNGDPPRSIMNDLTSPTNNSPMHNPHFAQLHTPPPIVRSSAFTLTREVSDTLSPLPRSSAWARRRRAWVREHTRPMLTSNPH